MLAGKQIVNVNVESIIPNRYQPRMNFDDKKLEGLAASIKKNGMIQPIVVRQIGNNYEIIVGERRLRASILAGFKEVPVIINNISDKELAEIALIENVQRQELSPMEEALFYQKLQEINKLNINDIAVQTGKTVEAITSKMKLLTLSEQVQNALIKNQISEGHARLLTKIADKNIQNTVLAKIREERLPVKETDEYIVSLNVPLVTQVSPILGNSDVINLNDLNAFEDNNMKNALDDLEVTNINSDVFADKDIFIEEKKEEEKIMNMNSLNQVAQTNVNGEPIQPNNNMNNQINDQARFFPSFDGNNNQVPNMPVQNNNVGPLNFNPEPVTNIPVQQPFTTPQPLENNGIPSFSVPVVPEQMETINTSPVQSDFRIEASAPVMPDMSQNYVEPTNNNMPNVQALSIDVAINNTRNLVTTLESMGYTIIKDEYDIPGEYQFVIKIKK